jgi:hypothetical protein
MQPRLVGRPMLLVLRRLARRAERRHQQGAELVAVQGHGMGLVVQPRPTDMGSWGAIQEPFLDRVAVKPGHGGQPPGDGGPGRAPGFQVAGEGLDVGAADGEQGHRAGPAPGSELAQIQRVSLAGQAALPSQEPGNSEPLGIGAGRLDGDEGGSGHRGASRTSWDPGCWASRGPQRSSGNPT